MAFPAVGAASNAPTTPRAASAVHPKKLSAKERSRIRRSLARQLKRHPGVVLSPKFIRQATAVEFRLPMSVRLSRSDGNGGYEPSDDQLEITWDDSAFVWPLAPDGVPAGPQTVSVSGGFTMEAVFNGADTSGYDELGATETVLGGGITMSSDPFTISEFSATCATPQQTTDPAARVTISSAGPRFGVMNLFSRSFRGTLNLRMEFARSVASTCGDTPVLTQPTASATASPLPLRFDGQFSISPSITPDGKIRFGKVTIDDAITPQLSTFGFVRACSDGSNCDPLRFPARLKVKRLTAEVLLGDVFP